MNGNFQKNFLGFTLIELMITVSIIGIIAAIAYPAYNQHILKTHRAEGKNMLIQAIAFQERYHIANGEYAAGLDAQGLNYPSNQSEHGYYSLNIENQTNACPISICYEMTVTAIGPQVADTECARMSQTSTGRKKAFSSGGDDKTSECW